MPATSHRSNPPHPPRYRLVERGILDLCKNLQDFNKQFKEIKQLAEHVTADAALEKSSIWSHFEAIWQAAHQASQAGGSAKRGPKLTLNSTVLRQISDARKTIKSSAKDTIKEVERMLKDERKIEHYVKDVKRLAA